VVHTPGHSPGHVCFLAGEHVWDGDVLFAGSVGRTDLPGGSWEQLERSIRECLFTLPDTVRVHPGHGPATTIGQEKRDNPFVGERTRIV
jgi:hydroxyacylglutathione hydrolase